MRLRNMTAEVVELYNVVIEEKRYGETIYYIYDSVKALVAIGYASTSVIRIRKETIAAHVARSRQKGEKTMLFRSNCVRPVYAVYGRDEGDHTVAVAYVYDPNRINEVRSMMFLEYDEVVFTEVRIEIMKFDGWRVIG